MQIEALKGLTRAKNEREYHFRSDPVDETTPSALWFCAVDKRESIEERRDRRQKKMRRTQEKFLEAIQERVPRAKFAFGAGESTINGRPEALRKMTASIKGGTWDKLCDHEGYVEDQEIKRKQRRTIEPA